MMTNSLQNTLSGLILEYDSGVVPPPYSHVFRLALNWKIEKMEVKLTLHYTDREDLSEQEILDEGFTANDDYTYEGLLNSVWVKPVNELFKKTRWINKRIEEGGITVVPIVMGREEGLKIPSNQEEWQLMAQDLIQAIYETVKKEMPLKIHYRQVDNDKITDCSITIQFSNREVIFEANGKSKNVHWEYALQLMKLVFTPDYHYELAREEPGKKRGIYIECGDGFWHELGRGVVNIDQSFDAIGKIKAGFEELISG